jgi:hypothetical protein
MFRVINHKAWVHFYSDFDVVLGGKFCLLFPIGNDGFIPLPLERLHMVSWELRLSDFRQDHPKTSRLFRYLVLWRA